MRMFDKTFLVNKVVNALQKSEYETFLTQGSFDIAARKEHLLLIKTLLNVDALTSDQALSLRAIAHFVSAYPLVVSLKNNREFLKSEIVYSRFELPVLTPEFFESMIVEDVMAIRSAKGRHTVDINSTALRDKRQEMGLTLEQLADAVGISKKALYEIENKRVNPSVQTARKLELMLGVKLRIPYEMKAAGSVYLEPGDEFQRRVSREFSRIGIDNTSVYSSPFEIIGRERFSLITSVSKDAAKIRRSAGLMKRISSFLSTKALFISRKTEEESVEGIPVVLESELPEIESGKEFSRIIEEKEE